MGLTPRGIKRKTENRKRKKHARTQLHQEGTGTIILGLLFIYLRKREFFTKKGRFRKKVDKGSEKMVLNSHY